VLASGDGDFDLLVEKIRKDLNAIVAAVLRAYSKTSSGPLVRSRATEQVFE
jgi:uncharacterized LabA/DUF88 family protein